MSAINHETISPRIHDILRAACLRAGVDVGHSLNAADIPHVQAVITRVQATIATAIAALLAKANGGLPVLRLPADILYGVVSQLTLAERVRLSHVCRRLRDFCVNEPTFWHDIRIGNKYGRPGPPRSLFHACLQRSGDTGVSIDLQFATDEDLLLVQEILHRVRRLRVANAFQRIELLWLLLERSAPLLTDLILEPTFNSPTFTFGTSPREFLVSSDICARETSSLRLLSLVSVRLPRELVIPAFQNIQVLHLHHDLRDLDLSILLDAYSKLEALSLYDAGYRPVENLPSRIRPAHHLKYFVLENCRSLLLVEWLLSHIRWHNIQHVGMNLRNGRSEPILDYLTADHITELAISQGFVHSKDLRGHERIFNVRPAQVSEHAIYFDPRAYSNLRVLLLDEDYWPQQDPLPPVPLLETLEVNLLSSYGRNFGNRDKPSVLGMESGYPAWSCPSLRTLTLSSRFQPGMWDIMEKMEPLRTEYEQSTTVRVSSAAVEHFVGNILRVQHLEHLVLRRVLITDLPAPGDYSRLLSLVDHVDELLGWPDEPDHSYPKVFRR